MTSLALDTREIMDLVLWGRLLVIGAVFAGLAVLVLVLGIVLRKR